jgi:hypothetical protein
MQFDNRQQHIFIPARREAASPQSLTTGQRNIDSGFLKRSAPK